MGCGSSSLKGEKVGDVTGDGGPARKVQTNFSDVNFSSGAGADRRGTMALAPDEQHRPSKISEDATPDAPKSPTKSRSSAERAGASSATGAKLEQYHTNADTPAEVATSHEHVKKSDLSNDMSSSVPISGEEPVTTYDSEQNNPIKVIS